MCVCVCVVNELNIAIDSLTELPVNSLGRDCVPSQSIMHEIFVLRIQHRTGRILKVGEQTLQEGEVFAIQQAYPSLVEMTSCSTQPASHQPQWIHTPNRI